MEQYKGFEGLVEIVQRLRAEDGCPWDRAQTHESLKAPCIEEAAEVVGAINLLRDTGKGENLKEELGDLLLNILLQAQIASEEGLFDIEDVIEAISRKMIRRHPHVFGGEHFEMDSEQQMVDKWEELKKKEKKDRQPEDERQEREALKGAFLEGIDLIERAQRRKGF